VKILIVNHNSEIAADVVEKLVDEGFSVEIILFFRPALKRMASGDIDVSVLSLDLPDVSGAEAVRMAKEIAPYTPIIALVKETSPELEREVRTIGVLYYYVLPLEKPSTLYRVIKIALRARRKYLREKSFALSELY